MMVGLAFMGMGKLSGMPKLVMDDAGVMPWN